MSNGYKTFKTLLVIFIIVVAGFFIYDIVALSVSPPSFYSLGITSDSVIVSFEKMGFNFVSTDSVYRQPLTIGSLGNKDAAIHLIGPKENLVNIKIVIRLSKRFSKPKLKLLRSYLENMIRLGYPDWTGGNKWLEKNAIGLSGSGRRTKILEGKKLTLTMSEKYMSMGLAIGDWDDLPKYDSKNQLWKLHD